MNATAVPAQSAPTPFPTPRPAAREQEIHAMQRTLTPTSSRQHQDEIQFRIILGVTYPFFLIAAVAQRLAPAGASDARRLPAQRRSVFAEAKAMAVQAIPFAFMG